MLNPPETITLPLEKDNEGTWRISGTRVTLDVLIARYHQGDTPEAFQEGFPTVPLNAIYALIAYYLANRDAVDAYLLERRQEAERIRQQWENRHPPPTKAELLSRPKARPIT